jgi:3-keto steroid reductase
LVYAALVDEKHLLPPETVPAQKFETVSTRWGKTYVGYGEVDHCEDTLEIGEGLVRACEAIRVEWRRREGLE